MPSVFQTADVHAPLLCQVMLDQQERCLAVYAREAPREVRDAWRDMADQFRSAVRMRVDKLALEHLLPLVERPERLMASARHLFCPAPLTWIETPAGMPVRLGGAPARMGVMLEATDDSLQAGIAMFHLVIGGEVLPIPTRFDLRRPRETMITMQKMPIPAGGYSLELAWMEFVLRHDGVKMPSLADLAALTVAILSLLSSPRVHAINRVEPRLKRNLKRAKRGKWPLLAYDEVTINLAGVEEHTNVHTGTGAPRALHFVRAHLRLCWSGVVAWVMPHWRGDGSLGIKRPAYRLTA